MHDFVRYTSTLAALPFGQTGPGGLCTFGGLGAGQAPAVRTTRHEREALCMTGDARLYNCMQIFEIESTPSALSVACTS
jgi:hypothetical protein